MGLAVKEGWAIPFDAPFYPLLPAWYRGVRFQKLLFRAEPLEVGRLLPDPLKPSPDGWCVATGIEIPFSTAYGPFTEAIIEVCVTEGAMLTRASMAGVPVLTISTSIEVRIPASELPAFLPSWRLKLIPRADRPGPAVKQLIDASEATLDPVVHAACRGRGTVQFEPSPFGDLTGLRPLEYGEAFYFESDFGERSAEVAYDYLADE